jgi:hypothetical protein
MKNPLHIEKSGMNRLIWIERILVFVALGATIGAITFGCTEETSGVMHLALDTGFDGGAAGMGLIAAAAIYGVVQIEMVRYKEDGKKE